MKSWRNRALGVLMTLTLATVLAACSSTNDGQTNNETGTQPDAIQQIEPNQQHQQSQQTQQTTSDELKTQYPLTVTDATGEEFTFEQAPERIISVSPAETESLFAIGLDQEIIGVSDYDDYPAAATTKTKMGGITKPNEEAIIAAKPDIVFSGISMEENVVNKLRELGITVFKVDPRSYDDVMANIELFGQITDHQAEAKQVVDHLKQTREEVRAAVAGLSEKKNVYLEFSPGWTVGSGEFLNELVEMAGGVNVVASTQGWVQINEEHIIKSNPDVILYAANLVDYDTNKPLEDIIKSRSGWNNINAIQDNQVVGIEQNILNRPGPRIAEGLKAVAKAIYPDLFN